jgi:serine/threonine protein kinase
MGQLQSTIETSDPTYIPVDIPSIEVCERYTKGRDLKKGGYGTVSQACCNRQCKYIVKIQRIEDEPSAPGIAKRVNFEREVSVHSQLAKAGLAPKIYKAWVSTMNTNEKYGYIVMDPLLMTVREAYEQNLKSLDQIQKDILNLLCAIHKKGYVHRDFHFGNMMYGQDGKAYAIDFGLTFKLVDTNDDVINSRFIRGDYVKMIESFRQFLNVELGDVQEYIKSKNIC